VGSPVAKIVCTLTIEAGEDGKLRMRTDSANFDADDEPLEGGSGGSGAGGHGRQLLLLLLALAGSGWLLVRARRSPAAAPRAATANAS
ncbi:MAG: hypothetical protein KDE27_23370, partial [Planctomycetes bacterium]|nr:hypothetical protein [Planctomycetota bacterium]